MKLKLIPKTKSIIEKIKEKFPNLLFSEDYEIYQGVIISKNNYNGKKDISLEKNCNESCFESTQIYLVILVKRYMGHVGH